MNITLLAVRGAVGIDENKNESQTMVNALGELMDALEQKNGFTVEDIVSVQFTQTSDLHVKNAAAALRQARPGYGTVPLFCSGEPEIDGSPKRMVRVLVTWRGVLKPVRPVYLGSAAALRPDLAGS